MVAAVIITKLFYNCKREANNCVSLLELINYLDETRQAAFWL